MKPAPLLILAALVVLTLGGALWLLLGDEPATDGLPGLGETAQPAPLEPSRAPEPAGRERLEPRGDGDRPAAVATPMIEAGDAPALVEGRVIDRAGQGQAGAVVELLLVRKDGLATRFITTAFATETDADGRYELVGVPTSGGVAVEASLSGFAPGTSLSVQLEPGESRDLGDLVLTRGTQLVGRVSDPDDQPVADAVVRAIDLGREQGPGGRDTLVAETLTDADGRYVLPDLARRQYTVDASKDGYAQVSAVLSFVLGAPDGSWTQDLVLEPADQQLGGQLMGSDDKPAVGVELRLLRRRETRGAYSQHSVVTDGEGRFLFASLPGGRYDLSLTSDAYYLPAPKRLEAGRTDHVVRVQRALAVNGQLITEGSVPLPRAFDVRVRPDGRTGATVLDPKRHTRRFGDSEPVGSFRFDGLRPGTYAFDVIAKGFAVTRSQHIVLDQNTPEADLVVPMLAGGSVRGSLHPVPASARVELREGAWDPSLAIEHAFPTPPAFGLVTQADAEGAFRLDHVPPGEYVLSAHPAGSPPLHIRAVNIVEGVELDLGSLAVQVGGRVVGQVIGTDGRPSPGAQVSLSGSDLHQRVTADAEGRFAFPVVPPGHYQLGASPAGLWEALKSEARDSVDVVANGTSEVELTLAPRQIDGR